MGTSAPDTSLLLRPAPDTDLERLQHCVNGLELEIRALPRAAQLRPIPGLRAVDARAASLNLGSREPSPQTPAAPPPRNRKVLFRASTVLIMSTLAAMIAGYLVPGGFAQIKDEFDPQALPSLDALRGELLDLMRAAIPTHTVQSSDARGGAERAAETVSLQPAER
jgi:hypothetical protein